MDDDAGRQNSCSPSRASFGLACPVCRAPLAAWESSTECARCGQPYAWIDGIWRFLPPDRRQAYEDFLGRYRVIRSSEGWGSADSVYYQRLPFVSGNDPQKRIWRIRAKGFRAFTRFFARTMPLRVLDAGAGNCWLSSRLALLGNTVASVDISVDPRDGLGARVHHLARLECYEAEFDRVPFQDGQFDMVVFNGSLHYTPLLTPTLREAGRVLLPAGRIVIMDSPFFSDAASGLAMVEEMEAKRARLCGCRGPGAGTGFLTAAWLQSACRDAGLEMHFLRADANWHQKLRRRLIRLRIGREPARFPIIMIEKRDSAARERPQSQAGEETSAAALEAGTG